MPRIPQLESTVQQAAPSQGRFSSAMPNQSTAGIDAMAKSLSGVADALVKQGQEQVRLDAESEVVAAMGSTRGALLDLHDQIQNTKGTAAFEPDKNGITFPQQVQSTYNKTVSETTNGIKDEQAKVAYSKWAQDQYYILSETVNKHSTSQRDTTYDARDLATIKTGQDLIAFNPNDANTVEKTIADNKAVVATQAARKGWTEAEFKEKAFAVESSDRRVVAESISKKNPIEAQKYYDSNFDRFTADDRKALEAKLGPLASDQKGFWAAQDLIKENPAMSYKEADKRLVTKLGDDLHALERARNEFKTQQLEIKQDKIQYETDTENGVHSIATKIRENGAIPKRSDIPDDVWNKWASVNPKGADELMKTWQHERMAKAAGDKEPTQAQWNEWYKLMTNPQGMANTNLMALYSGGKLNKGQFTQLAGAQAGMIKQEDKSQMETLKNNHQMIDTIMAENGIKKQKQPGLYEENYAALSEWFYSKPGGEYPKAEAIRDKLKYGIFSNTKVDEDGMIWNSTKPVGKVPSSKIVVPKAMIPQIDEALKAQGKPLTKENRQKEYRKAKVQGYIQ